MSNNVTPPQDKSLRWFAAKNITLSLCTFAVRGKLGLVRRRRCFPGPSACNTWCYRSRPPVAPGIIRTNQRPRNLFQPIRMRSGANEVQLADGSCNTRCYRQTAPVRTGAVRQVAPIPTFHGLFSIYSPMEPGVTRQSSDVEY